MRSTWFIFSWRLNGWPKVNGSTSKCKFAQCCGHVVVNWPVPISIKEVRSFLGLTSDYHKFVQILGLLARQLTNMLNKNTLFVQTT
jgi:hypothetical protein